MLVLWGEHDVAVPVQPSLDRIRAVWAGAGRAELLTTAIVKGTAHSFALQKPRETMQLVADFFIVRNLLPPRA